MSEHLPECPKSGCPACVEQGITAARDAVAGIRAKARQPRYDAGLEAALAAIDALERP